MHGTWASGLRLTEAAVTAIRAMEADNRAFGYLAILGIPPLIIRWSRPA